LMLEELVGEIVHRFLGCSGTLFYFLGGLVLSGL
jgi:hypothetical protein